MSLLTPKLDIIFKLLFAQDTDILLDLVNCTLASSEPLHIQHLEVKNPIILPEELTEKYIILDILAQDDMRQQYDIEMQVQRYSSYPQRAVYYLSRLYGTQLERGQMYGRLMPVIGIHFLDYEHFPEYADNHFCFEFREKQHPELRLTRDLALHMFELPKVERSGESEKWGDPLWEWLHFFNHAHEEDESMQAQYMNPKIHEAFDRLGTLSADEITRQRAELREKALKDEATFLEEARVRGLTEGRAKGIIQGREEGRAKGREEGRAKGREEGRAKGREEGREEGLDLGELIGEIRALQRLLKQPVERQETLQALPLQDLQSMLKALEAALS